MGSSPDKRTGDVVGVLLIDLDDFKAIKDRHGHPTGDQALSAVSVVLRHSAQPQDLLERLGGDEFVMVCEGLTDAGQAPAIACRMTGTLEDHRDAVMVDFDASVGVLAELRELGVRLSMDDFGTGYSWLTYLRRIRVDTLKIDRSFVRGLGSVPEDAAIVQPTNLGHSYGIEVVAEGVEPLSHLDHLIELECDYGQG